MQIILMPTAQCQHLPFTIFAIWTTILKSTVTCMCDELDCVIHFVSMHAICNGLLWNMNARNRLMPSCPHNIERTSGHFLNWLSKAIPAGNCVWQIMGPMYIACCFQLTVHANVFPSSGCGVGCAMCGIGGCFTCTAGYALSNSTCATAGESLSGGDQSVYTHSGVWADALLELHEAAGTLCQ